MQICIIATLPGSKGSLARRWSAGQWPDTHPVPQASVEFDVDDVEAAARELESRGYRLLHGARTEPWGHGIARLQSADGVIVGVSYTPWMRDG